MQGDQIVVKQGQTGGVLWFHPKVVDRTPYTTSDIVPAAIAPVRAGVQKSSLADAKRYVTSITTASPRPPRRLRPRPRRRPVPSRHGVAPSPTTTTTVPLTPTSATTARHPMSGAPNPRREVLPSVGSGRHAARRGTQGLLRPVPADPSGRARWHGAGVPGHGPAARPTGRPQGPLPRALHRPDLRRAVPAGGPGGGQPVAPQHRSRLRLGRGRRRLLHRHGVHRRPSALRGPARPPEDPAAPDRADRGGRGRRSCLRPPPRRGASRRQARKRAHHARRGRQGDRLRHRPRGQHGGEPHPDGRRDGYRGLLLPRAGGGQGCRCAQRHLLARGGALRDDRRPSPLHRRLPRRRGLEARARHARTTAHPQPGHSPGARGRDHEGDGQGPRRPLRDRPRNCGRTCSASPRVARSRRPIPA